MLLITRRLAILLGLAALAACTQAPTDAPVRPADPIADFRLGHVIVIAKDAQKGPMSRDASPAEIEAAIKAALTEKFGALNGESFYHLAVAVGAYALAQPGIPLVVSPKSALVADVTLWNDRAQRKINPEPKRFTVIEDFGTGGLLGSGFTLSREEQLRLLTVKLADQIEAWIRDNADSFFAPEEGADGA